MDAYIKASLHTTSQRQQAAGQTSLHPIKQTFKCVSTHLMERVGCERPRRRKNKSTEPNWSEHEMSLDKQQQKWLHTDPSAAYNKLTFVSVDTRWLFLHA